MKNSFLMKTMKCDLSNELDFIRINIILSKCTSSKPEKLSMQKKAKYLDIFFFLKKHREKDFLLDGSWFVCP